MDKFESKKSVKATISNPDNGMHASMCGNTTYQAICVYVHILILHAVDVTSFLVCHTA